MLLSDQSSRSSSPKTFFKEDDETEEPPAKRPARGSVSPLANSLGSAPGSPFSSGSSGSPESHDDVDKGYQSSWQSSFRDQDDFEYTVKLLRRSMGEPTTRPSPPAPMEVLARIFPDHRPEVLELVLKGCDGNLIQAIESILASECISQKKAGSKTPPRTSRPAMHLGSSFPSIPSDVIYPSVPLAAQGLMRVMRPMCFRALNMAPRPPLPNMAVFSKRGVPVTSAGFVARDPAQIYGGQVDNGDQMQFPPSPVSKLTPRLQRCFRCGATPLPENKFCGNCGAELAPP